jgi:hypothetical protein
MSCKFPDRRIVSISFRPRAEMESEIGIRSASVEWFDDALGRATQEKKSTGSTNS